MPVAKSLADLMKIRAHPENRAYLDKINGNLGTALGLKRRTGESLSDEPSIIVFVPEKIHPKWIPAGQLIKKELKAGNLVCRLDVVAGGKSSSEDAVPESGSAIAQRLRGWDEQIWCGSQVSSMRNNGEVAYGSLGAFVQRNSDGVRGFITNDHVSIGPTLWHPWAPATPAFPAGTRMIGAKQTSLTEKSVKDWYGPFAVEPSNPSAAVRVDCAFVSLSPLLTIDDINPEPMVDKPLLPGPFGPVFDVDLLADMTDPETRIIGRDVCHVGRTTGLRGGKIAAFGYEWEDQPGHTRYTDLLIQGETPPLATGVDFSIPFSYKGDSGSVIFTRDKRQPIALLWGGFQEQLRGGDSQENWSYATCLDRILEELDLTILTHV